MEERDIHAPDKQGFIPSIFNWCDRRCERCAYIRQCRVGIMEADDVDEDREIADERPEDHEERLRKIMGMPKEDDEDDDESASGEEKFDAKAFMAEAEASIDDEEMEEYGRKRELVRAQAEACGAVKLSNAYMDLVDEWIEPREEGLKARGVALHKRAELGIDPALRDPNVLILTDAIDTVLWFQRMLYIKTMRAVQGKIEDPDWMKEFDMDPLQGDPNGTAKLCLHIVAESRGAWGTIADLMPEEAESLQAMLEALRRCEEELRKEFPGAEKFVRPGFDKHMGSPKL